MACIDENFLPRIFFSQIFLTMNFSQTTVEASLYFVGIYTAKETYICVTCEINRLVGCTIFIKTIGTTGS